MNGQYSMLEALRKRIGGNQRTTVINVDFATPAWAKSFFDEKTFEKTAPASSI